MNTVSAWTRSTKVKKLYVSIKQHRLNLTFGKSVTKTVCFRLLSFFSSILILCFPRLFYSWYVILYIHVTFICSLISLKHVSFVTDTPRPMLQFGSLSVDIKWNAAWLQQYITQYGVHCIWSPLMMCMFCMVKRVNVYDTWVTHTTSLLLLAENPDKDMLIN